MYELRCNGKTIAFFPILKSAEKHLQKLVNKDMIQSEKYNYNLTYKYEIVKI